MFVILVLILVLLIVCYEIFYDRRIKRFGRKIAGPPIYPIVGNGHLFIGSSAKFRNTLDYLFREFGSRSRVFLGTELFIFISNPQDVEALMTSMEYISKSSDYNSLKPWLGQGLLTTSGARWKAHRKFLTPAFHFSILQDFVPVFERNAAILAEALACRADGRPFDVYPYITLCALDDICETAMGVEMGAQNNKNSEYVNAVKEMSTLANYRMRHFLLRHEFFFNISRSKVKQTKALEILHAYSENVIRNRKKQIKDNGNSVETTDEIGLKRRCTFLDLLLLSEVDGHHLSDESVREEVDTFMFEGHDTTTSGICFALYLIGKHPDVQRKLYEEQEAIFRHDFQRDCTYGDLNEMKYMDLVIKESLRLYPSVPLIGRSITRDTNINGMELPRGSTVLVDVLHLQRNPALFDEPLQFVPERFELDSTARRSPFSWLAFSAGPRNCIGQRFAMLDIKSTLSRLLRAYQLRAASTESDLSLDLTLKLCAQGSVARCWRSSRHFCDCCARTSCALPPPSRISRSTSPSSCVRRAAVRDAGDQVDTVATAARVRAARCRHRAGSLARPHLQVVCAGQRFAMLEIKSTLSRLLRTYELRAAATEPDLSLDLILKPADGIKLALEKRQTSSASTALPLKLAKLRQRAND